MLRPSSRPPSANRAWTILVVFFVVVRLLLPFVGRSAIEDPFYLRNAMGWALGDRLYDEVPHVAFPIVEAAYAALFRLVGGAPAAASWLTAALVLLYASAVRSLARDRLGDAAGLMGGGLVLFAAPVLAFHWFEREIASGAFAAAGAALLLGRKDPDPRRAVAAGAFLALALAAKLTALWAVLAVIAAAWSSGRGEAARAAFLTASATLLALTAWLTARHQGEFLVPTFLFFFFRGEAHDLPTRALVAWSHVGPLLALGLAALPPAFAKRLPLAGFASGVALLYAAHYTWIASSFWNHNVLDFLLPAALGAGSMTRLGRPGLAAAVLAAAVLALPQTGLLEAARPTWFPLGFGGPTGEASQRARWLAANSAPEAFVIADPEASLRAGRRSLVADWEIEPVVRGLIAEVRLSGLAGAWSRRKVPALLGGPRREADRVRLQGPLFQRRVLACSLFHMSPRLADSVRLREPACALEPLPPAVVRALEESEYRAEKVGGATGWRAPR